MCNMQVNRNVDRIPSRLFHLDSKKFRQSCYSHQVLSTKQAFLTDFQFHAYSFKKTKKQLRGGIQIFILHLCKQSKIPDLY